MKINVFGRDCNQRKGSITTEQSRVNSKYTDDTSVNREVINMESEPRRIWLQGAFS